MLSVKSKYGVSAVLQLSGLANGEFLQIKELSEQADIPRKYLEHILSELKKEGLLHSTRGATGGYQLAKKASDITVFDVVRALEHDFLLVNTYNGADILHAFWADIDAQFETLLKTSFFQLMQGQKELTGYLQYSI